MDKYLTIDILKYTFVSSFFTKFNRLFVFSKTLKTVGDAQIFRLPLAELSRCDCDPNKPDPCSSDEHCLNRMLKYECHPHVCAAGKSRQYFSSIQFIKCCSQH